MRPLRKPQQEGGRAEYLEYNTARVNVEVKCFQREVRRFQVNVEIHMRRKEALGSSRSGGKPWAELSAQLRRVQVWPRPPSAAGGSESDEWEICSREGKGASGLVNTD